MPREGARAKLITRQDLGQVAQARSRCVLAGLWVVILAHGRQAQEGTGQTKNITTEGAVQFVDFSLDSGNPLRCVRTDNISVI